MCYVLGVHFIEGSVFYKISYFATLLSFSGTLISYNFNFEYECLLVRSDVAENKKN